MPALGTNPGFLLLEDGTLFRGTFASDAPLAVAEVVFTTNMTGYQEVFTDPSYRGQIVVMTAPMIGNYGTNEEDPESERAQVAGVIVRELSSHPFELAIQRWLAKVVDSAQIPILQDVDTRRLTRHLRRGGVMRGVVAAGEEPRADAVAALQACPSMEGLDLASRVSTANVVQLGRRERCQAYRRLRLRDQAQYPAPVCREWLPSDRRTGGDAGGEAMELGPDGVFLANGPGDPAAVSYAPAIIRTLAKKGMPVLGICLGHQLLGLTYGARRRRCRSVTGAGIIR